MSDWPCDAEPSESTVQDLPRLELLAGKVVVFYTQPSCVSDPDLLAAYWSLLGEEERVRQRAFRFAEDRHLYLVAHALLRTSLSQCGDIAPADWRFESPRHGRPELAREQRQQTSLRFNLSHTPGLAACAIARDTTIGIDVEKLGRPVDIERLARRHFAPQESVQLARLTGAARALRFLEYWTLKESYVKACGCGLSIPLHSFHFDRDSRGQWRIGFVGSGEPAEHWQFSCLQPSIGHVMSVAVHCRQRPKLELDLREVTPLR